MFAPARVRRRRPSQARRAMPATIVLLLLPKGGDTPQETQGDATVSADGTVGDFVAVAASASGDSIEGFAAIAAMIRGDGQTPAGT